MREALWRSFSHLIAVPWVSRIALRLATLIDRPLMRVSDGRWRLSFIIPCVLIECRGARSGLLREVPLLCVPDGEDLLVVGSNGGAEREPAWCANLRAFPEIQARYSGQEMGLRAVELEGAQRARAWRLATDAYPGYVRYQARLSRQIPLFRLSRSEAP
ncbi:MAG: nitroreductase/quinone reductase family protein [Pseudomonadales bacterium]|nr:nitroreductase family deazaflavin-dependent oxidoreductase [Pseudomonadales bacterium]